MKFKKIAKIIFSILLFANISAWKYPETGLTAQQFIYQKDMTWHNARGFVDFENDLLIENGSATLGITIPLAKDIYFKTNSLLTLDNKLELESNSQIYIDDLGFIYGEGNDIQMHTNLIIPSNRALEFLSDTIIDGMENQLILSDDSQLIIDSDVTVTLKNLRLKTSLNSSTTPPIKTYLGSKLCLQNVELDLGDKYTFENGNIFINNDVKFIGGSEFVYSSTQHLFIAKDSTLIIDFDTRFTYSPYNTNRDLIVMNDVTSKILLNGGTLATTYTGIRLTKGRFVTDNQVTFSTIILNSIPVEDQFISFTPTFSDRRIIHSNNYTGTECYTLAFSPDGTLLAVGGSNNGSEIEIHYTGTDGSLNRAHVISSPSLNTVNAIDFSPDEKWIAIGGNNNVIETYKVENDVSLTLQDSKAFIGTYINAAKFSDLGNFLVVGGYNNTGNNVEIFALKPDGNLISLDSKSTATEVYDVSISPDESLLSVANNNGLEIYNIAVTGKLTSLNTLANPTRCDLAANGRFLAVEFSGDLRIYEIDSNGNLLLLDSVSPAITSIESVNFSPDSNFVVIGGANVAGDKIEIYYVDDDGTLILKETKGYSGSGEVKIAKFSPDNYLVAATGIDAANAPIEIHPFILDYNTNYYQTYNWISNIHQPMSVTQNGVTFGNSEKGSEYNLFISILGSSKLNLYGTLNVDNVS
ncbi:MAG: hypothetical protein ABIA74_01800 [bacterium]